MMTAEELFNAICERIPEALIRHKVPGVALGITCEGQDFVRGFGVTSIDHPLPVDENTLFQIGSTTKTFTATAAMRLVEQGKLKLDEPIRTYLPDFSMRDPEVTERVTMRHLLTHTGGWQGDFFPDTGNGDDALSNYVGLLAGLPQLTRLGTVWSYNNSAFSLAGRVIEVLAGKPYEAALKDLILKPLGLKRSYLFPTEVMVHRFAVGHAAREEALVLRPWQLTRATAAAGGIAASIMDQLRYARFHLREGADDEAEQLLSRESMQLMQTPDGPAPCDFGQGLAWRIRDIGGVRRIFHGGGTFGQISVFTLVPQRRYAFVFATNSMNGGLLVRDVGMDLSMQFFGNEEPEPEEINMDSSSLSEYCGKYSAALNDLEVSLDGQKLMVQPHPNGGFPTQDTPPDSAPPPPFRVAFIGRDRIAMVEPPMKEVQGEFLRAPDDSIRWLRWGGRIHRRL
jgi:CubicO group peptidase (beta-lactamase class C family)